MVITLQREPLIDQPLNQRHDIYEQIVEHARGATGAGMVILATWSPETGIISSRASAGFGTGAAQRARRVITRLIPGFDPDDVSMDVHVNAVQEKVFLKGESVTTPFFETAVGVVPDIVLQTVSRLLRVRYSTVQPLVVRGQVLGSLSFHGAEVPSKAMIHAYEAFTKQAALTIENKILLESLRVQMEELREVRRMVSAANEAARREIAETLHGPVQTQLLVADFTLSQAAALVDGAPGEAKQAIADARSRIDEVREHEIREVSHLLHPSVIKLGLAPAIRSLAARFQPTMNVRLDIAPELDGVGSKSEVELDVDMRLVVYRVVEEAFANARKHGHASSVEATVCLSGVSDLLVVVRDDGEGLPDGKLLDGLGLRMIAMKVQDAGGAWSLSSHEDRGAVLTAVLPLTQASIAAQALPQPSIAFQVSQV